MSDVPRDAVSFVFAVVRKQAQTVGQVQKIPAVAIQLGAINVVAKALAAKSVVLKMSLTTYRNRCFTDELSFLEAVIEARKRGALLIVGDIFGSVRGLDFERARRCFDALDESGLVVVNAADGRIWSAISAVERQVLYLAANRVRTQRSQAIKKGLPDRVPGSDRELAVRQKRGAAAGSRKADRRALALAPVVREIADRHDPSTLSDARLARELNNRGIETSRGEQWSPMSARRLRLRLDRLSQDGSSK